jgi:hypothetical protein
MRKVPVFFSPSFLGQQFSKAIKTVRDEGKDYPNRASKAIVVEGRPSQKVKSLDLPIVSRKRREVIRKQSTG